MASRRYLARVDRTALTVVVDELEQMLARNLLAAAHNFRYPLVVDEDFVLDSALAAEVQHGAAVPYEAHMAVSQCRKTETLVVPGVLGVADSNPGGVQQTNHDSKDFFPRQARQCQIALQIAPQLRQALAERHHARKLRAVAQFAPRRVITILLAPACVPSRRLQMTSGFHADPHVAIRRWNREARDALQIILRRKPPIFGRDIAKAFAGAQTPYTRLRIGDVNEPRFNGHLRRLGSAADRLVTLQGGFQRHSESLLAGRRPAGLWARADGV
jgi:hypothetical protein